MEHDKVDVHNIFKGMGGHDGGLGMGGIGGGLLGGVLASALFRGGRGGLFGGGGDDCGSGGAESRIDNTVFNTALLQKLGTIEAAIPLASAQTENVILQQTNQITTLNAQSQVANAAGFASVKDAVTNTGTVLLQALNTVNTAVLTGTQQAIAATNSDGERTRALITSINDANLNRMLTVADLDRRDEAHRGRGRETEFNITQNTNVAVAQAQAQAQQQSVNERILSALNGICISHNQLAAATNANLIIGSTGVATGPQSANPVNVR